MLADQGFAQQPDSAESPGALKKLTLEQLMNLEVTSVSKRPEKLAQAASAIQVITEEDIRRSGAASLPEALRLASNLEVAQVDSRQWAISARGFNSTTANKLLVLIDGRTVYTPLYSGVFWDVQDVPLWDVDRIEVIRDREPRCGGRTQSTASSTSSPNARKMLRGSTCREAAALSCGPSEPRATAVG